MFWSLELLIATTCKNSHYFQKKPHFEKQLFLWRYFSWKVHLAGWCLGSANTECEKQGDGWRNRSHLPRRRHLKSFSVGSPWCQSPSFQFNWRDKLCKFQPRREFLRITGIPICCQCCFLTRRQWCVCVCVCVCGGWVLLKKKFSWHLLKRTRKTSQEKNDCNGSFREAREIGLNSNTREVEIYWQGAGYHQWMGRVKRKHQG